MSRRSTVPCEEQTDGPHARARANFARRMDDPWWHPRRDHRVAIGGSVRDRKRRDGIGEKVRSLGFDFDPTGFGADAPELAFIGGNPLLKYRRNAVKWLGTGDLAGRFLRVLEYWYETGGGKSRADHYFLIVATDLPIPAGSLVIEPQAVSSCITGRAKNPSVYLRAIRSIVALRRSTPTIPRFGPFSRPECARSSSSGRGRTGCSSMTG